MDRVKLYQGYKATRSKQFTFNHYGPGTNLINLERMKDWVDLGTTKWFWIWDP